MKEQLTALRDIITPDNLQSIDENINAVSLFIDSAACTQR